MKSLGAGADVVSLGELQRAISIGIPSNKIIFELHYFNLFNRLIIANPIYF